MSEYDYSAAIEAAKEKSQSLRAYRKGKLYDTQSSTHIMDGVPIPTGRKLNGVLESLYITKTGVFFLHRHADRPDIIPLDGIKAATAWLGKINNISDQALKNLEKYGITLDSA